MVHDRRERFESRNRPALGPVTAIIPVYADLYGCPEKEG